MRLETIKIKAEDCPMDVFVYIPEKKRFFFVDNKDIEDTYTTLYFEPDGNPDTWTSLEFENDEIIECILHYQVNKDIFYS